MGSTRYLILDIDYIDVADDGVDQNLLHVIQIYS